MYVCPMHPEVTSKVPGRCPKCGMALVKQQDHPAPVSHDSDMGLGKLSWRNYQPLLVIVLMIFVTSIVVTWRASQRGEMSLETFILSFMTGFFLVFGSFKLMDIKGFVEGYSTYDLLAQRVPAYGYVYPFIELGFGLSMLAGFHPTWLLGLEFTVMAFSGVGVALKLMRGEKFQCACLGTFLKVPLTYITLIEDFGMALLALLLIILR